MLVLSRKENEEIIIGENVSIKIVGVVGNKVRLGISAPEFVSIRRAELDVMSMAHCLSPRPSVDRQAIAHSR